MDELREEFKRWWQYAEDETEETDFKAVSAIEQSVRAHQATISIMYRPTGLSPYVVPVRIVALLLTALEAITIHIENLNSEWADEHDKGKSDLSTHARRISDQKALIQGYLRRLRPFIFEDSTPLAPQSPLTA